MFKSSASERKKKELQRKTPSNEIETEPEERKGKN